MGGHKSNKILEAGKQVLTNLEDQRTFKPRLVVSKERSSCTSFHKTMEKLKLEAPSAVNTENKTGQKYV